MPQLLHQGEDAGVMNYTGRDWIVGWIDLAGFHDHTDPR